VRYFPALEVGLQEIPGAAPGRVETPVRRDESSAMKLPRIVLSLLVAGIAATLAAQQQPPKQQTSQEPTASDMEILREKVKADKKLLVASNMKLTEQEGKAFWPVYDSYQKDLQALNERLLTTIKAYADAYNKGPVPDDTAQKLMNDYIKIEEDEAAMKRAYVPKLQTAVSPAKAARYLQIETKIRSAFKYDLAKEIPLVQ
jgi:hypothetical protein